MLNVFLSAYVLMQDPEKLEFTELFKFRDKCTFKEKLLRVKSVRVPSNTIIRIFSLVHSLHYYSLRMSFTIVTCSLFKGLLWINLRNFSQNTMRKSVSSLVPNSVL